MKLKIIFALILLASAASFIFTTRYEFLDPGRVMVVANETGSPMVLLSDGDYFVRDWVITPGCYQLTRIRIIDFNFATVTAEEKCR